MGDAEPAPEGVVEATLNADGSGGFAAVGDVVVANTGSGIEEAGPPVISGGSGLDGGSGFHDVTPQPYPRRQLIYAEAEKLAELPRHRFNDFMVSALWGVITGAAGGFAGYVDIVSSRPATALRDLIELGALAIAATVFVVGLIMTMGVKTSKKYLKELYPETAQPKGFRAWLIKKLSDGA